MTTQLAPPSTEGAAHASRDTTARIVLAVAGALLLVGGAAHPPADTSATYEHAVAEMLHDGAWPITHGLVLIGMVALALGLFRLRSTEGGAWSDAVRRWTLGLSLAAVLGVVEMVPHLLVYLQVDELERHGSASLLDVHMAIQAVASPALGVCFAGVAIATARRRELGNGPVLAVLAVVGGIVFGLAGPLMAIRHDPALSPLFSGAAGVALWLLVGSLRGLVAARRSVTTG